MSFTHRSVEVLGTRLNYIEEGRGTPVLFVAGWPQSVYAWRYVVPALAATHRVVAVDPPGLGESGTPHGGYDTANIARYIDAFVDALGFGAVDFVGHDIGAWIGYAFAVRHPDKLRRLVLIDAAIPGMTPSDAYALTPERIAKTWHFYFNALPDLPEALTAGRERLFLSWLFKARSSNSTAMDEALDEYTRVYSAPGAMHSGFQYYRAVFQSIAQNRETASTGLAMPVLAMGGADWLGPVMQKMIEAVAKDLRVAVIEGSGHFVPEEAPTETARLLKDFLA